MKWERHVCDICGGTIPKEESYGQLAVPKKEKRPREPSHVTNHARMLAMMMGADDIDAPSQTVYDICLGCISMVLLQRDAVNQLRRQFESSKTEQG